MENTLLNLVPASYLPEVHLSQYDIGRELKFTLKDGSSDYSVPDGAVVTVKATKPSGLGFVVNAVAEGSVVTLSNTETMTNENGRFPAELSIVSGNVTIGTSNFIFNIERSPHPEGTIDGDAESLLPELTLLVERIEAAADSVDEDTQTVTEAKAEVLQAKADTLQAKADTLSARDDALQAKADTIAAKESAEASAQAAEESAQRAEDTLSDYAKVDGYYEEMAVGSAEQLLSTQFVEDSVPYKFRTSGGSKDIGNREYDEIVGGSIVWNQLMKASYYNGGTDAGVSHTSNGDGTMTLNGTATNVFRITQGLPTVANHVYYVADALHNIRVYSGSGTQIASKERGGIIKQSNSFPLYAYENGSTFDNTIIKIVVFDLTQMFGSTIADHIYSLEQAEEGKGVAFFKSLFPNDYYPYNAGELLSVEGLQSHDTVGFNQWDEEWELGSINTSTGAKENSTSRIRSKNYIPVLPNTQYYFYMENIATLGRGRACFYDSNKQFISGMADFPLSASNSTFETPSNAYYMLFSPVIVYGTTYNHDICINLSWSGWRNGEYEPYKKHSYPLDSSLTLRGMLKLNAQNELYFDGDIYPHDGEVTRKYKEVLINGDGSYSFGMNGKSTDASLFYIIFNDKKNGRANMISDRFMVPSTGSSGAGLMNGRDGSGLVEFSLPLTVNQDSASANAWFSANPTRLIYELATTTEETAEPYTSPQAVDDFGTEEYISGNVVPVGHNTQYPANLRDKLQHLPNLADNDGYYMISQQNKQMSLELFRIPKAPTTDGTYTLKATVSGGTPTYIWEAVE